MKREPIESAAAFLVFEIAQVELNWGLVETEELLCTASDKHFYIPVLY